MKKITNKKTFHHYLYFLLGQQFSMLGSMIVGFVISWYFASNVIYLSISVTLMFLPQVIIPAFSGVIADRWNKKLIIAISDSAQALLTFLLFIFFLLDIQSVAFILTINTFRAASYAFQYPTVQSLIPTMVPKEQLSRINGLNFLSSGFIFAVGPMIAASLMFLIPQTEMIFLLDIITFLIAIVPLVIIKIPEVQQTTEETVKKSMYKDFKTGLLTIKLVPGLMAMIVFAMTAQISILAAFLSTLIPGILMMAVYCVINLIMSKKMGNLEVAPRKALWETFSGIAHSTRHAGFALFMPILVLGGIYGGVFTPTEAAAISGFYAVLVGFVLYRTMTFKNMCLNIKSSMITSGAVMILLFFILMVSRILVAYQVPQYLTSLIFKLTTNKLLVLLMINVILLFMGMLVDDVSGNILSAAILLPIAKSVGIDPVHYAAISVTNLSLGNITPPCAPMLYLAGMIGGNLPLNEYVKPASYFMIFGALPVILAVTYVPEFALVLVNLFLR